MYWSIVFIETAKKELNNYRICPSELVYNCLLLLLFFRNEVVSFSIVLILKI